MKTAIPTARSATLLCFAALFLLGRAVPAGAALVSFTELAVNDADGSTLAAVTGSRYLEQNAVHATATAPPAWSGYRFCQWSLDGSAGAVRDAWGRSVNPAGFVLLAATTATAHYLPASRDSDADGVPDWFELEHFGTLGRAAADDGDADGVTLAAEFAAGTHPLHGNLAAPGGVTTADSALVTCNLAGYATYTVRSEPAGVVNQTGVVPPGTVVTTPDLAARADFGAWTLNGALQADAWGVALTQLTFTVGTTECEAVAYLLSGDSDGDGVPDAYEQRHLGTLAHGATHDSDGDGITLLAEYTAGTNPRYPNVAGAGGVVWTDSALVTCNLAGYATYTLRSVPAGTVSQSATVPPGTRVTTADLAGNAAFGYWTLDGVRQEDAWGVALTQLSFLVDDADREAVAYLFAGDTDADGVPDAFEQRYHGTLGHGAAADLDLDGVPLAAEAAAGTNPNFGNRPSAGGVVWTDSALLMLDLQADVALQQPAGTALADGGTCDFGAVLVGQTATLTFVVLNSGGRDLTGLALTLDGAGAAQFAATPATLATIAQGQERTFTVRFTPASPGAKSAALHLVSNDPDESPFDITLLGTGLNNPPTISEPDAVALARNGTATISVTLGDVETSAAALTLGAESSNHDLLPDAHAVVTGTGATRSITLMPLPGATGTTVITLTVNDGELSATATFEVTVTARPPLLTLGAADGITAAGATLHGTVDTRGFATETRFEFGPDIATLTPVVASVGSEGGSPLAASAALEGLAPWTTYYYRLAATSEQGASATAFGSFRTAGLAPEIVTPPAAASVTVGDDVSLGVVATGTPAPAYAWWKDGEPVAGADAATLRFAAVRTEDAGVYHVVVSNAAGSVTSPDVTLAVARRAQTIQFDPLPAKLVGDTPFTLTATASSGLPVSFASSNPAVATISGTTVTLTGAGTTTITASQGGDETWLPAAAVSRTLEVAVESGLVTVLADEFTGAAGAAPDAAIYQWSGDVALNGTGQVVLSTVGARHSWLRTREGRALGTGETMVVRFRAYAYAEHWNPGVYGDGQPRGVRVGTDANNAVEFFSVTRTRLGLRARRDGVETSLTYDLPGGVDTMNDYEITLTAEEAVFRVNGALAGTISERTPTGVLTVFFSSDDGGSGNVPVSVERLAVEVSYSGFDLWRATKFEPAELLDAERSGPNAVCASDGLPNLVKYALGLEPKEAHAGAVLELAVTASEWTATFRRAATATDVTCAVEVSVNLTDWSANGVTLERIATADGLETWRARHPRADAPRLFFRLKVTR